MALFFLIQITKDNAMDNSIINLPNFPDFTDNNYLIFKDYLKTINQILHETLFTLEQQGPNVIQNILIARTHIIDKILNTLFEHFFTDINHDIALFAVGGYGRSELFPHSDVDILIFGEATKKPKPLLNFILLYGTLASPQPYQFARTTKPLMLSQTTPSLLPYWKVVLLRAMKF